MSDATYKGKIGRLPRALRDEVCRRMRDGESDKKILVWLNGDAEAKKRMEAYFDGQPVNGSNLSEWRAGGYQDWKRQQDREAQLERMCQWAMSSVDAKPGEAASAIAAGHLLSALEAFDVNALTNLLATDPRNHAEVIKALATLRRSDAAMKAAEQNTVKLQQAEEALRQANERLVLDQERFKRETCEMVQKALKNERLRTEFNRTDDNTAQLELIGRELFGDRWKGIEPAT